MATHRRGPAAGPRRFASVVPMRHVVGAAVCVTVGCWPPGVRRRPRPRAAGSFPGGKVEPGEAAARGAGPRGRRGARVHGRGRPAGWPARRAIGETHVLRGRRWPGWSPASRSPPSTTRSAGSAPEELDDVDWLDPDRPFLAELAARAAREPALPTAAARGIFFEEDDARAVGRPAAGRRLRRRRWPASGSPARTTTRTTLGGAQRRPGAAGRAARRGARRLARPSRTARRCPPRRRPRWTCRARRADQAARRLGGMSP